MLGKVRQPKTDVLTTKPLRQPMREIWDIMNGEYECDAIKEVGCYPTLRGLIAPSPARLQ